MKAFFANMEPCLIGMEACGSAHHWARQLQSLGHEVKLISPQFVKPFVKTNKHDVPDAEVICESVSRPTMRFVPVKNVESYRKSPHTDAGQTGERAAECMVKILKGEIHPSVHLVKPGVLVPSIFSATDLQPLASIIDQARQAQEQSQQYLDITVMAGFSYTDAPNTGFSVMCTVDGDPTSARNTIQSISDRIYRERQELYRPVPVYNCSQGIERVEQALRENPARTKPFVLLEHADRINDSSYLLDEMVRRKPKYRVAFPFLWDPEAAKSAQAAGVGKEIRIKLGGHSSDRAGPKVEVIAKVVWVGQKSFRNTGSYMRGLPVNLGLTALLDVQGMSVSVTTKSHTAVNGDPFYIFDQQPSDFDVIVLRSKTHFRAFYEEVAQEILIIDTPDYGPADLMTQPYHFLDTTTVFPFQP